MLHSIVQFLIFTTQAEINILQAYKWRVKVKSAREGSAWKKQLKRISIKMMSLFFLPTNLEEELDDFKMMNILNLICLVKFY